MLSNEYFIAKFRFDAAENEPAQKWQRINPQKCASPRTPKPHAAEVFCPLVAGLRSAAGCGARRPAARVLCDAARHGMTRRPIGNISAKFRLISAVSAPIFARNYAFFSIFQNLPDYLAEIFEIWQIFLQILRHLQDFC